MSEPFDPNADRPRPSYGLPAEPLSGSDHQHPQYGQPSAPSADPSGADYSGSNRSHPSNSTWTPQPSSEQGHQSYPAQQGNHSDHTAAGANFGGYETQAPEQTPSGTPAKKQKPVGIVLTVLGVLGMAIGIALIAFGVFKGIGAAGDGIMPPSATNTEHSGTTATTSFKASEDFQMYMFYVPEEDSNATCTAMYSDGTELMVQDSQGQEAATAINGKQYRLHSQTAIAEKAGFGTITCENVSAPVAVQGPLDMFGMAGWFLGGVGGGLALGGIGFLLFIAGIIVMLVRARKRKSVAA